MSGAPPTKSQVNKAGRILRKARDGTHTPAERAGALDVLFAFRSAHALPLTKANNGVRSMIRTAGCDEVEVSQRLKRIPTIVDKLSREPTMALANMGDIGGVRAVLSSIDEVRRVEKRIRKARPPVIYHDYIDEPRDTGYRAVHLVVLYDDRRIEAQLRTRVMHEWAFTVERLSGKLGEDLKGGRGPVEVVRWFKAISEAMALEEAGLTVDETMMEQIDDLRAAALPHLVRGTP